MLVEMDQMSLAGNSPDAEKQRRAQRRRPFIATGRYHMVGRVGLGLNLRIVGNEASVSSTQEDKPTLTGLTSSSGSSVRITARNSCILINAQSRQEKAFPCVVLE